MDSRLRQALNECCDKFRIFMNCVITVNICSEFILNQDIFRVQNFIEDCARTITIIALAFKQRHKEFLVDLATSTFDGCR